MEKKSKAFFIVLNEKGLHTRPSTELVKCVSRFSATVRLSYRDYVVDAKSILGILMLAAEKGAKVSIEAVGKDAEKVIKEVLKLAESKFHINY